MSRFDFKNRNLIIDCFNDLPSHVNDDLAFLSFYSFYNQFGDTLKPLIFIPSNKRTCITYWALAFKIPVLKKRIDIKDIVQKPAFYIESGMVILDQNFESTKSFDAFESHGIKFLSEIESDFYNFGLIGELEDNFSSSFINLNKWIYKNNIVNTLSNCYGYPSLSKRKEKPNEILFGDLLDKAHKTYKQFPEIR